MLQSWGLQQALGATALQCFLFHTLLGSRSGQTTARHLLGLLSHACRPSALSLGRFLFHISLS